jgi:hypothetical protein
VAYIIKYVVTVIIILYIIINIIYAGTNLVYTRYYYNIIMRLTKKDNDNTIGVGDNINIKIT